MAKATETIRHIIIVGDIVGGLSFWGPFESEEAALNYGDLAFPSVQWSVAAIEAPIGGDAP